MNQKWTRAICTVLTSALVFTGPAVEGTTFSGYINSGLGKPEFTRLVALLPSSHG